jgi:metallo-beta-lactamase class B
MTIKQFAKWTFGISLAGLLMLSIAAYSSQVLQVRLIEATGLANWQVTPVKIADNLYYVGGYDAAAYLLTGDKGHILIDGAYADSAPLILTNIVSLGFKPADVKIILNTHGHFDHAAGIAALKRATGARLYASLAEAQLIEAGGRGDFHFNDQFAYEAVRVDNRLSDRETVSLGSLALMAHITPGHTKGCTSWAWATMIKGKAHAVLLNCSISLLGAPLKNNRRYPTIASDFAATFTRLESLGCDIFLMPHGTQFDASAKAKAALGGDESAFVDPIGCKAFIANGKRKFEQALAENQ